MKLITLTPIKKRWDAARDDDHFDTFSPEDIELFSANQKSN